MGACADMMVSEGVRARLSNASLIINHIFQNDTSYANYANNIISITLRVCAKCAGVTPPTLANHIAHADYNLNQSRNGFCMSGSVRELPR